jgi:hypothetical protein
VDLDSEQTLVLVFGAPALADRPGPLTELARAFPRSKVLGCSTAGEILGTKVLDDSMVVAVARFEATRLRGAAAPVHAADGVVRGRRGDRRGSSQARGCAGCMCCPTG